MNAPEPALSTNGVVELHQPPLIRRPEAPTQSSCPLRTLAPALLLCAAACDHGADASLRDPARMLICA
jgi:hypothetical protein